MSLFYINNKDSYPYNLYKEAIKAAKTYEWEEYEESKFKFKCKKTGVIAVKKTEDDIYYVNDEIITLTSDEFLIKGILT